MDNTEGKQMEPVQKESEEKFRILAEQSPNMIFINKRGRVVYANEKCEEVMGYKGEEFYSPDFDFLTLIAPEHQALVKASFNAHLKGKEALSLEYALVTKEGKRIEAILATKLIRYEGEVAILGTVTDITKRKRAEEALQTAKERYEMATQAAKVGVWDWNLQTKEFYLDPSIKALLGYSDEEIPNDIEIWTAHVHPDDRQPVIEAAQAHLEGRTPEYIYEHRMLHKDGSVRWFLIHGTAIRDAQGNATRLVGTDTDITERKWAEETLQKSEIKFRSLVEQSHDGVILIDEQGKIVEWNYAQEQLTGVGQAEAIGQYAWDIQFQALPELERSPEKYTTIKAALQHFFETGQAPWLGQLQEANIGHTDGTRRVIQQNSLAIETSQGFMLGAINRDITVGKRAEQILNRRVEELAALNQIAQLVTTMTDLPAVLGRISQVVTALFEACFTAIVLPTDGENGTMLMHGCTRETGLLEPSLLDPALTEMPLYQLVFNQPEPKSLAASTSDRQLQSLADFPLFRQALSKAEPQADPTSDRLSQLLPPVVLEALAPGSLQSLMLIPLVMRGDAIGFMFVATDQANRSYTADDVSLAETIAGDIASAVENTRLLEKTRSVAIAKERSRLARELHDSVTQTIYSVSMMAEALPQVWDRSPAEAKRNLVKLRQMTLVALTEMRALLFELRPAALEKASLDALLRQLSDVMVERGRIPVKLTIEGEGDIPQEMKTAFYRISQEVFSNILKHAEATEVVVTLRKDPEQVILTIRDNGQGFDPENMLAEHLGVGIMRERAKNIGAGFQIDSAPEEGTQISVTWPDPEGRR